MLHPARQCGMALTLQTPLWPPTPEGMFCFILMSRFLPRERREAYTCRYVTRQSVFCERRNQPLIVNKCENRVSRKFIRGGPLPPANPCDVAEAAEADVTRGPLPPLDPCDVAVGVVGSSKWKSSSEKKQVRGGPYPRLTHAM